MTSKKLFAIFVFGLFALSLSQSAFAQAQSADNAERILEVSAGTAPDSFFYGFKRFGEGVQLFFTFDELEKAKLKYRLAQLRLAEAGKMADMSRMDSARDLLGEYERNLEEIESDKNRLSGRRNITELADLADDRSYRHMLALQKVYEKVPESAKPAVANVMDKALERQGKIAEKIEDRGRLVNITIVVGNETVTREVPARHAEKFLEKARELKREGEIEIENEAEIKEKIAERIEIRRDKAQEQINDAREEITEAGAKVAGTNVSLANDFLSRAEERLAKAEQLLNQSRFGEAFGQAVVAENFAKIAEKLAERKEVISEETRVRAEVIGNASQIRVEAKFVSGAANRTDIAQEILSKLKLNRTQIESLLRVEIGGTVGGEAPRLQAEAKIRGGMTEIEAKFRFPLNVTNRTDIVEGAFQKLNALTADDILRVLETEEQRRQMGREHIQIREIEAENETEAESGRETENNRRDRGRSG